MVKRELKETGEEERFTPSPEKPKPKDKEFGVVFMKTEENSLAESFQFIEMNQ